MGDKRKRRSIPSTRFFVGFVLASAVGACMLAGSWLLAALTDLAWLSDALLNLGSAILLFAPLLFLTEWLLDERVGSVEATVDTTRDEVRQTQREVADAQVQISALIDYRSEDGRAEAADRLDAEVRGRMFEEHNRELDLFASLAVSETAEPFVKALEIATRRGYVSESGPRVQLLYSELHLRFRLTNGSIDLVLESNAGEEFAVVPWAHGSAAEVLAQVTEHAKSARGFDGMDKFFPGQAPKDLAELLTFAARHSAEMTGDYRLRRLVQITDSGWIITDDGLIPKSVLHYLIRFEGASPIDWNEHIRNKQWDESYSFPYVFEWASALDARRRSALAS